MKKLFRLSIAAFLIVFFSVVFFCPQVFADSLTAYGAQFQRTQQSIDTYHFALWQDTSNHTVLHVDEPTINYYLDGSAAVYKFVPILSTQIDIPAQAASYWGGWLNFSRVNSASDAHVSVQLSTTVVAGDRTQAITLHGNFNTAGNFAKDGSTTMIFYLPNIINWDSEKYARVFAHEMGHVAGLADVYPRTELGDNINTWPDTCEDWMGLGSLTTEEIRSSFTITTYGGNHANHVGLVGANYTDRNGLYVLHHNPWYRSVVMIPLMGTTLLYYTPWRYWQSAGVPATGWQYIKNLNGSASGWYYFEPNASPQSLSAISQYDLCTSEWINPAWAGNSRNTWAYLDASGAAVTGWQRLMAGNNGYRYFFFDPDGSLYTNSWIDPSWSYNSRSTWSYVDSSGYALCSWQNIGGFTYYFWPPEGKAVTGWHRGDIDANTYYFYSNGKMFKGWHRGDIDEFTYFFDRTTGQMYTDWNTINGSRYYFYPANGKMFKGFHDIDGFRYFFNPDTGEMLTGKQKVGGYWYYFYPANGKAFSGWHRIDGDVYYFSKTNYYAAMGNVTINGVQYSFDYEGRLLSNNSPI